MCLIFSSGETYDGYINAFSKNGAGPQKNGLTNYLTKNYLNGCRLMHNKLTTSYAAIGRCLYQEIDPGR